MSFSRQPSSPAAAESPGVAAHPDGKSSDGTFPPEQPPEQQRCNFCRKYHREVSKLIAGETAYICNECVAVCNQVLEGERLETRPPMPASVDDLVRALDNSVVGHMGAKRALAAALFQHVGNMHQRAANKPLVRSPRVLLAGSRGTGKTALLRALTQIITLPARHVDTSSLTNAGYVGEYVENILQGLLNASPARVNAEHGMVLLDSLHHSTSGQRDGPKANVQRTLVRVFDGFVEKIFARAFEEVSFPTEHLLLAGAVTVDTPAGESVYQAVRAAGIDDELLSRFDLIVPLRRLSPNELAELLTRANGMAASLHAILVAMGGSLHFAPDGVAKLVEVAAASDDGAFVRSSDPWPCFHSVS